MTIICPTCQTPNEATHRFCPTCGTALAAPVTASPTPEPARSASPTAPPLAESAVSPPPPAPPDAVTGEGPHLTARLVQPVRLTPALIIGGVLAALILAGSAGVALGIILNPGGGTDPSPAPIPTERPTVGPAVTAGPGVTPGPVVTFAPTPTPDTGGGSATGTQTIENNTIMVTVPADWKIDSKDNTVIGISRPAGGAFLLKSGTLSTPSSTDAWLQQIAKSLQGKADLDECIKLRQETVANGPVGKIQGFCYTATTSSGQLVPLVQADLVGFDQAGVVYEMWVVAGRSTWNDAWKDFWANAFPSIKWKLYAGQ